MISVAIALHALAAVLWVGGMFFAYQILRPAVGPMEPAVRLPLWSRVFTPFFAWVWATVILLPATGHWMIVAIYGGFATLPVPYHIMMAIGWLMVLLFLHLWFAPYARFRRAMAAGDLPAAATAINGIRRIVGINLILGLINVVLGAAGRFLV
jgi:uncharacterized membrane protein